MKKQGNKILFEESDIHILSKLKEMNNLMDETVKLKQKCEILKRSAYSEVELFAMENNIPWTNMAFDDNENCIIIKNKKSNGIMEVGDDFLKNLLGLD